MKADEAAILAEEVLNHLPPEVARAVGIVASWTEEEKRRRKAMIGRFQAAEERFAKASAAIRRPRPDNCDNPRLEALQADEHCAEYNAALDALHSARDDLFTCEMRLLHVARPDLNAGELRIAALALMDFWGWYTPARRGQWSPSEGARQYFRQKFGIKRQSRGRRPSGEELPIDPRSLARTMRVLHANVKKDPEQYRTPALKDALLECYGFARSLHAMTA